MRDGQQVRKGAIENKKNGLGFSKFHTFQILFCIYYIILYYYYYYYYYYILWVWISIWIKYEDCKEQTIGYPRRNN